VTDPRWVNIVESNIEEILTDHAWCNKKAVECNKFDNTKFGKEELVTESDYCKGRT
jgi:tRNA-(ms[2]io[6]A)-hydroxylase